MWYQNPGWFDLFRRIKVFYHPSILSRLANKELWPKGFRIGEYWVPIRVYIEGRRNVRASIRSKQAILRLPTSLSKSAQLKELNRFQEWITQNLLRKPSIAVRFKVKTYENGQRLTVGNRHYIIQIAYEDRKTIAGTLKNGTILLRLRNSESNIEQGQGIRKILSRIIGKDFQEEITIRVNQLNEKFFRRPIKEVYLKYNQSNWGSCSSTGNINLSTRLLFAPQKVIDYVIIHELAHLEEFNHSKRFWQIVEKIIPDYKKQELWLKEYGSNCDF